MLIGDGYSGNTAAANKVDDQIVIGGCWAHVAQPSREPDALSDGTRTDFAIDFPSPFVRSKLRATLTQREHGHRRLGTDAIDFSDGPRSTVHSIVSSLMPVPHERRQPLTVDLQALLRIMMLIGLDTHMHYPRNTCYPLHLTILDTRTSQQ